jgi:benzoyl-CoA reductase/2-hydroxyglutaryl-CoA dehydratase subunit BcrC/BadD/HgdB
MGEVRVGLVKRSYEVLKTIEKFRKCSRDEIDGLIKLLGETQAHTLGGFLDERHGGAGLQFAREILTKHIKEAVEAREEGKKVIMIPFNFPPEVIHAFENAVPFTTEVATTTGVLSLEGQGEPYWDYAMSLGIPDYVCSANTIALGSILMSVEGLEFAPDAMISAAPGACDANSKIHEFVSEYLKVPEFIIDKTGDGRSDYELYRRLFFNMLNELENFVGEELDEDRLIKTIERANESTELYWELHELKKHSPCPVPNMFTLFTYGTRFTMWGREEAVSMLEKLVEVSEKRLRRGEYPAEREIARAIWVYTGYYIDLLDLWLWMEDNGITYLTDLLNSGSFPQLYEVSTKEEAMDALVSNAWNYVMTRQMGAENMGMRWVEDVAYLAKELNANCGIYSGHHACKQSQSVFRILRDEMSRAGVPILRLDGDCWNRRITPVSVLQELILDFVHNVVARRKRRRRKG